MKLALKFLSVISAVLVVFLSGVVVGNSYQVTDLLCPAVASPHELKEDLVSESGIIFPKGTIVPLRQCAYMQRFNWHFVIDHKIQLANADSSNVHEYGFSELSKRAN